MNRDERIEKLTRPLTAEDISYHAASDFEDGRIAAVCEALPIIRKLQTENSLLKEKLDDIIVHAKAVGAALKNYERSEGSADWYKVKLAKDKTVENLLNAVLKG